MMTPRRCYELDLTTGELTAHETPWPTDEELTWALPVGSGRMLVLISGCLCLWTPSEGDMKRVTDDVPAHTQLASDRLGAQLHLWLTDHNSGSAAGFDYETNCTYRGVVDLNTGTLSVPFSRRVDANVLTVCVTADGATYICHAGRIHFQLARVPDDADEDAVRKPVVGNYALNLSLPHDGPYKILGRDRKGAPIVLAENAEGLRNHAALLRLDRDPDEHATLGTFRHGGKKMYQCAMGPDDVVYVVSYKSRRGGCTVWRWAPGDTEFEQVAIWSGDWYRSTAFAVTAASLVFVRDGEVFTARR